MRRRLRRLRVRKTPRWVGLAVLVVGIGFAAVAGLALASATVGEVGRAATASCSGTGPCDQWSSVAGDAARCLVLIGCAAFGAAVATAEFRGRSWTRRSAVLPFAVACVWLPPAVFAVLARLS
ncbi:hypothetical protein ACIB24_08375 [Spongisporangium articulatum]|uniref:Uncharacterized protein n=1 Tax=Spongisporangium articulatum TaxID=3362603 RepID=A0ABW8ALV4_9ACTN